jgi:hypothetical protein
MTGISDGCHNRVFESNSHLQRNSWSRFCDSAVTCADIPTFLACPFCLALSTHHPSDQAPVRTYHTNAAWVVLSSPRGRLPVISPGADIFCSFPISPGIQDFFGWCRAPLAIAYVVNRQAFFRPLYLYRHPGSLFDTLEPQSGHLRELRCSL